MHSGRRCLSRLGRSGRRTVLSLPSPKPAVLPAPSSAPPVAGPSQCRCLSSTTARLFQPPYSELGQQSDTGALEATRPKYPPKGVLAGIRKVTPHSPEMVQTIKRQRIRRAEQQERVDIYSQLSESSVKSFSGGFTRPKIFRALNRLEFDPWANETERRRAWSLVKPLDDAYRPHSVLLLATRYPVIHQIGEPSHVDFKVEYCAREDVKSRLELWNGKPAMFRNNLGLWVQTEPPEDARDKYESALWPNEEARQRRRMPKLEAWEGIEQETLLQAEATADGGDRAPSHHETKVSRKLSSCIALAVAEARSLPGPASRIRQRI